MKLKHRPLSSESGAAVCSCCWPSLGHLVFNIQPPVPNAQNTSVISVSKLMYAAANAIISLEGNIACWRKWQYTNSIVNNSAGKTQQHSVSTRLCYSAKHSRNKVLPNQKLIKMRAALCNMNPCRREQTMRVLSACLEKRRGRAQEIDPLKWKRVGKIKLLTNSTVIYPPALAQK